LDVNPLKLGTIAIGRDVVSHPLLGDAHIIEHDGEPITAMSAIDWERPTRIPVVAEPGRLPPGTGGMLLNHIAELAQRAGVPALRYAGPYPTPALYHALLRSFRANRREAFFTDKVLQRALTLARDEVPVDFTPAPHLRVELPCGHAEIRAPCHGSEVAGPSGDLCIERTVIDGTAYERDGSPTRLIAVGPGTGGSGRGCVAEVWFGDAPWAKIAELDASGTLIDGPHPPPAVTDPVVGKGFPRDVRFLLTTIMAQVVPDFLHADVERVVTERTLVWADLGVRAARRTETGFAVHAAIWQRIAPLGLGRVALAIAEALAPVVTSAILAELLEGCRA
jgi:hypothetical protein